MQVSLVMVKEDGTSKEAPISSLPVTIGRGEECKVRIPLPSVSRKHCELIDEDDELVVRDLGSSNGTYVNGERVKSRELVPGDLLTVGAVVFVVRIDGHPKEIDAKDSYAAGAIAIGDTKDSHPAPANAPTRSMQAPKPASAANGKSPAPQAAPAPAKPAAKDEDDEDFSDLLDGLDFSDLDEDDDEPKKK